MHSLIAIALGFGVCHQSGDFISSNQKPFTNPYYFCGFYAYYYGGEPSLGVPS